MEFITITVGDQRIASKYLGVVIDNRLTLREHLTYIGGKCVATLYALARIMPNLGCPKQERRLLLMKVVTSIAIHSVRIKAGTMNKRNYRIGIEAAYRRSVLRVILTDAAVVIAEMMMSLTLVVDVEMRKRATR